MQVSREIEKNLIDVAKEAYYKRHKMRFAPLKDFDAYFGVDREVLDADIVQKLQPVIDGFNTLFSNNPVREHIVDIKLSPSTYSSVSITRVSVQVKNPNGFFKTMYIKDLYPEQYEQYFKYVKRAGAVREKMQDRINSIPRDLSLAIKMTPGLKDFHRAFPLWYSMLQELKAKQ